MNAAKLVFSLLACLLLCVTASAQEKDRPEAGGQRQPALPLIAALDANQDGILSQKEIEGAVAALKKLDKNEDGALSRQEWMGDLRQLRDRAQNRRAGNRRGNRPGNQQDPRRRGDVAAQFIERILQQTDQDKDGKIAKDEAPQRMKPNFDRFDGNGDGFLDKEELAAVARQFLDRGRNRRPEAQRDRRNRDRPIRDRVNRDPSDSKSSDQGRKRKDGDRTDKD